ncbi:translation elongation factor Ts [Candidatus Saccharibacteria bacterium RIFCSPHIGHO2_12_FULL_47_16b]|nr:MAG: translation elongation factor Ts [Candidatus Saccharibacteria bacterium RIFCSPHIGHO2_12_FULL_47_16b]OGL38098.1 MAG: translation elongation factor Ts [Candidatus Saccharibacteria bacterium RIFCSPLOWO2_02_FULL_46_7]
MAKVDINKVKRLRELTGVGITDAKAALVEAGGDFDKALAAMRQKGLTKAAKRAEREARAGLIGTYSHDGRIGVVVEVNCETDFVARTDEFKELVKDICLQIAASESEDVEALLKEPYIKNLEIIVGDLIKEHIAKLGENIVVKRFSRLVLGEVDQAKK